MATRNRTIRNFSNALTIPNTHPIHCYVVTRLLPRSQFILKLCTSVLLFVSSIINLVSANWYTSLSLSSTYHIPLANVSQRGSYSLKLRGKYPHQQNPATAATTRDIVTPTAILPGFDKLDAAPFPTLTVTVFPPLELLLSLVLEFEFV